MGDESAIELRLGFFFARGCLQAHQFVAVRGRHDDPINRVVRRGAKCGGRRIRVIDEQQGVGDLAEGLRSDSRVARPRHRWPGARVASVGGDDVPLMIARFGWATMVASTAPSLLLLIGTLVNAPVPSRRQKSVAVAPAASSINSHEKRIGSVDFGIAGECFARTMSGATLELASEFAAPGVPPTALLAPQLAPASISSALLRSSNDLPVPSASQIHSQPRCEKESAERARSAHSASLA